MAFVAKAGYAGIKGRSIIDHKIRAKLGLNCSDYCLLQFIESMLVKKKKFFVDKCDDDMYKALGIYCYQVIEDIKKLTTAGYLQMLPDISITTTLKWDENFIQAWEVEFNVLWIKYGKYGNRKASFDMYTRARKQYDYEYLNQRMDIYLEYLQIPKSPAKMHLSSWLNPEYKKFADEHYEQKEKPQTDLQFSI